MSKRKILYVPLDDRPVNADFPLKLLKLTAFEALTPPRNYLGRFTEPGDGAKITEWLVKNAGNAQSAVVSLDMLSFGGLFHSRKKNVTFHGAFSRLQRLKELKKKNPSLHVSALSVMLRLTISVENEEDLPWWEKVFQYAVLADKAEREGKKEDKEKLEALLKEIPGHLIEDFMEVRTRNHHLQLKMIEWVKDGMFDMLVFSQEDAHEFGLHRKEREALQSKAKELGVLDKIFFVCGADEIGTCLLTREVLRHEEKKLKVFCFQEGKTGWNAVSLFEDRSVGKTFHEHVALCSLEKVSSAREADIPVFLHLPRGEQKDLCFMGQEILKHPPRHSSRIETQFPSPDAPFALGDVAYCNGTDPHFIKAAGEKISFANLLSFSAWNTTSNTLGTLLSHAALAKRAQNAGLFDNEKFLRAHLECLLIRFFEDYVYSTIARPRINDVIQNDMGMSVWNFGNKRKQAQDILREWFFSAAVYDFYYRHFNDRIDRREYKISGVKNLSAEFPWDRTFEIRVEFTLDIQEKSGQSATKESIHSHIQKQFGLQDDLKRSIEKVKRYFYFLREHTYNEALVNDALNGAIHIRDNATMLNFINIRELAQEIVNVLDTARNKNVAISSCDANTLLEAMDAVMALFKQSVTNRYVNVDLWEITRRLKCLL